MQRARVSRKCKSTKIAGRGCNCLSGLINVHEVSSVQLVNNGKGTHRDWTANLLLAGGEEMPSTDGCGNAWIKHEDW